MTSKYFPSREGSPPPLRYTVERRIRFQEIDLMGVVWHGHYPSFFEDARLALGKQYGMGYAEFIRHQSPVPVKKLHVDHFFPLLFDEVIGTEAIMHWTEAARINFEFIIRNQEGEIAATGYTVQMMLDKEARLLLTPPEFYTEFCDKWKDGAFE